MVRHIANSQIAVLNIPHSSRRVPAEERRAIRLDDDALDRELVRMTDTYTDELFPMTPVEAGRVIFPVSRLICDVERFPGIEVRLVDRGGDSTFGRKHAGNRFTYGNVC